MYYRLKIVTVTTSMKLPCNNKMPIPISTQAVKNFKLLTTGKLNLAGKYHTFNCTALWRAKTAINAKNVSVMPVPTAIINVANTPQR